MQKSPHKRDFILKLHGKNGTQESVITGKFESVHFALQDTAVVLEHRSIISFSDLVRLFFFQQRTPNSPT